MFKQLRNISFTTGRFLLALASISIAAGKVDGAPKPLMINDERARQAVAALRSSINAVASYDLFVEVDLSILIDFVGNQKDNSHHSITARRLSTPVSTKSLFRQIKSHNKFRFDEIDVTSGKVMVTAVTDGIRFRSYSPDKASMSIRDVSTHALPMCSDYRETFCSIIGPVSIIDLFSSRKSLAIHKKDHSDSVVTMKIDPEHDQDTPYPRDGFRISLAPDHGMLPSTIEWIEIIDDIPRLARKMRVLEWTRLPEGIEVPIRSETELFTLERTSVFGELANKFSLNVDIGCSKWNVPIDDSVFELPVPSGIAVTDAERGIQYVTGKADPGKHLDELAANARAVMRLESSNPQVKSWSKWAIIGISLLSVAVISFGMYLLIRARRI